MGEGRSQALRSHRGPAPGAGPTGCVCSGEGLGWGACWGAPQDSSLQADGHPAVASLPPRLEGPLGGCGVKVLGPVAPALFTPQT